MPGLLLIAVTSVMPFFCAAQATPAGSSAPSPSKVDLYLGYGYMNPINSDIYSQEYSPIYGGVVQA